MHLIVYPDGSTNQPHPRKQRKKGNSALDTFFNLRAGYVLVQKGVLHYENRASGFDFQNRYIPLDFNASDFSLLVNYVPARFWTPQTGRIGELPHRSRSHGPESVRGAVERNPHPAVHGYFQATADLTRTALYLRSLRITSRPMRQRVILSKSRANSTTLPIPAGRARCKGELDMNLLDPVFGYPFAPEGIARLDLDSAGAGTEFHADGSVHIDNGSYIGTGVYATGIQLDAHVHADSKRLLISSVVARLRQGGQLEGEVDLAPWLPSFTNTKNAQPAGKRLPREAVAAVHCKRRQKYSPRFRLRPGSSP